MKSGMLGIPLKAGTHAVVLEFAGSARLWAGLVISAATWLGLLVWLLTRDANWSRRAREVFPQWSRTNQG
jgi:hypothetical protein